jgi:hypothetical protein
LKIPAKRPVSSSPPADGSGKQAEPIRPTDREPRAILDTTGPGIPEVDVLRRKLDAAIVAEEWEAVKIIHGRIVEVERDAMPANVIHLGERRR